MASYARMTLRHAILAVVPGLLMSVPATADLVRLTNGRSIEGIVVSETASHVELDLGSGSTRLNRDSIQAIEKGDAAANGKIEDAWRRKYFLHKKHVPSGLEDLAADFTKVVDARESAIASRRFLQSQDNEETALRKELDSAEITLVDLSRKLTRASPEKDIAAYNALIKEHNRLHAARAVKANDLATLLKRRQPALDQLAAYAAALPAFESAASNRWTTVGANPSPEAVVFFQRLSETLRQYGSEFSPATIDTETLGTAALVAPRINGKAQGRFILDTGAATVTLTEAFARRLELDLASARKIEVTLADGQSVPAHEVQLALVELGAARAHNVKAVVLATPPGEGIDGLLGMSFLRNFVVHLDGGTGKLLLKQFVPR